MKHCVNPSCGEWTGPIPLCASCRLAGAAGVVLAFVVGFLAKLAGLL